MSHSGRVRSVTLSVIFRFLVSLPFTSWDRKVASGCPLSIHLSLPLGKLPLLWYLRHKSATPKERKQCPLTLSPTHPHLHHLSHQETVETGTQPWSQTLQNVFVHPCHSSSISLGGPGCLKSPIAHLNGWTHLESTET